MNMNEFTDITSERDVSEEVMNHDADSIEECVIDQSEVPLYNEIPENAIIFHSMDGHDYMIDRTSIDWNLTAQNEDNIHSNMLVIRQTLMSLIFSKNDLRPSDTEFGNTVVKDMVIGFGCTPKYTAIFPDADDYDLAQLYCIDALQLMNLILTEVSVFKVNKSFADCLNLFSQEENTHEDSIQQDDSTTA